MRTQDIASRQTFIQKIQNLFNQGTVEIKIQTDSKITWKSSSVKGNLLITSSSRRTVKMLTIVMQEEWSRMDEGLKKTKMLELGKEEIKAPGLLLADQTVKIPFNLSFKFIKSSEDDLRAQGGVFAQIGKANAKLVGEQSRYFVRIKLRVEGSFVDYIAQTELRLKD